MSISTHVLDTSLGKPAAGIQVSLQRVDASGASVVIAAGVTNADGRIATFAADGSGLAGHHRLVFNVDAYFVASGRPSFYPVISVDFTVGDAEQHYHVPLLLNAFGYSTYRGS